MQGVRVATMANNLKSVKGMDDVVREKIKKEVAEGWVDGPFSVPTCTSFASFPMGVVPKKVQGEFHLIHHLSYPAGESVNDKIPPGLMHGPLYFI